jgi:virulence-associated protein VapD
LHNGVSESTIHTVIERHALKNKQKSILIEKYDKNVTQHLPNQFVVTLTQKVPNINSCCHEVSLKQVNIIYVSNLFKSTDSYL